VDGVESAEVDFSTKTVTVSCSTGCDKDALVSALEKAGFGGDVK
jgi:copper chaperone CopZ